MFLWDSGINPALKFGESPPTPVERKNAKTPGDQTMMATTRKRLQAFYDSYNIKLLNFIQANKGFEVVPDFAQLKTNFEYEN